MQKTRHTLLVCIALLVGFIPAAAVEADGSALYTQRCAGCHDKEGGLAPDFAALRELPADAIVQTLSTGSMRFIGWQMPASERRAVARFLSRADPGLPAEVSGGKCDEQDPLEDPLKGARWIGWGGDLHQSRFQPANMARLAADDLPRLKLKWAFGFAGANMAWAQPAVAGGRLFVGSARGTVYSLDAASGCTHWAYEALGPVRTAIQVSRFDDSDSTNYAAYFADLRGNLYAVDAETGEELWKLQVEDHLSTRITSSPVLYQGRIYVGVSSFEESWGAQPDYECCTFRGSVAAIDADTGERVWKTYTEKEPEPTKRNRMGVQLYGPSGAGVWTAPTIDERLGRLYVTTGDNYSDPASETSDAMLALDLDTGEILWSQQFTKHDAYTAACLPGRDPTNCPDSKGPDFDFGSSPQLVSFEDGQRLLVAGQKSGWVHAVDPDQDGEIIWQHRAGRGGVLGGVQWGPAVDADKIYVALSDIGFRRSKDAAGNILRGINPTVGGGLIALNLRDGARVWRSLAFSCNDRPRCSPGQSAAVTLIPGVVFSGALDGHLRAYSTEDGSVLWDLDTVRDYDTVNGVTARGGSLNGPGPVIVDGMLFVNSGYGQFGTMAGNVLLAFSVGSE